MSVYFIKACFLESAILISNCIQNEKFIPFKVCHYATLEIIQTSLIK